ncbi:unnamed protein product [Durusdinium trenchii]|uniref:Uncharacterized protein n=1 Tax=Durusdinium trenchii TaxID=1381693 RepID=A0ABP0QD73_9DINO
MSEQSRWFIKDKPLEEKIKACKKSLEAAQRSGRANIAKALEEKLVKLLDEQSPASKPKAVKGGAAKGKNTKRPKKAPTPREAKEIPLKKKKKETPRSASSKATHSANQPIQPAKQTKKTKTMKATRADEASASAPQAFRKLRKKVTTTQEPEKVKKKLKKKSQGSGNDHQTAIDLLLRAAAKAKAARAAAGEESEEEALMPDLPPAKCFTSMTADDGEPGFGEDDGHPNSTTGAEEEDDFFDAVEDPLVDRPEAPDPVCVFFSKESHQGAGLSSVIRFDSEES